MDDLNVAMSLLTIWLNGTAALDRGGEGVEFGCKLIDRLEGSLKPTPLNLSGEPPLLFKRKSWGEQCPAFCALNMYER